jgi:hypothetical protein
MGSEEVSHKGRRSKHRKRRGPWEIHYEWLRGPHGTGIWRSYPDEVIAKRNLDKFQRSYSSVKFTLVYNKDKEINGG